MIDHFTRYCALLFRAAGNDGYASYRACEMMADPRVHARLVMAGATSVLTDLHAVTLCRLMQQSGERIRDISGVEHLLRNACVQEIFPQLRAICPTTPSTSSPRSSDLHLR